MKMIFARYKLGWAKAASTYIYLGHGLMENSKRNSLEASDP